MLRFFMKNNKISIAKLTSPNKNQQQPSVAQKQTYDQEQKQKPFSQPIISAARSPNAKRRKIFQRISSPQSKLTAQFAQTTYSAVQQYQIRQNQNKPPKKKAKTNKENGLQLGKTISKQLQRQISRKSLSHIKEQPQITMPQANEHLQSYKKGESLRIKRIQQIQASNRRLKQELVERNIQYRQIQESLTILEPQSIFTFQSQQSQNSSLTYSNSIVGHYQSPRHR